MKIALLLIPATNGSIDRKLYLSDCIENVINEGYMPLLYDVYEKYITLSYVDFIKKNLSISQSIFIFEDFESGADLARIIEALDKEKHIYTKKLPGNTRKYITDLKKILEDVSDKTGIAIETLKSDWRKREVVDARFLYYRLAKERTKESLARIGEYVNKNHTTVLFGLKHAYNTREVIEQYDRYFG